MATARAAGLNPETLVTGAIAHADEHATWVFPLAAASAETAAEKSELDQASLESIRTVYQRAKAVAVDPEAPSTLRCQAIQLFGRSLGPADEPRLHELLVAHREQTGVGVLCNTSLNYLGRGFINRTSDLLNYCTATGIADAVVDGSWYRAGGSDA